jgi:hypothetical protein
LPNRPSGDRRGLQQRIAAEGLGAVMADVSGIEAGEPLVALVQDHFSQLRQGV